MIEEIEMLKRVDKLRQQRDSALAELDRVQGELAELREHSVKLPVDADGETIHIGDELECIEALHPEVPARFKVQDMFYLGNGEWHLRAYPATYDPKKCRHHHAPTVEDVLREFVERWHDTHHDDIPALFAEYAAKLRLAGDE